MGQVLRTVKLILLHIYQISHPLNHQIQIQIQIQITTKARTQDKANPMGICNCTNRQPNTSVTIQQASRMRYQIRSE